MDRFKYGTKEIIATALGAVLVAVTQYIQTSLITGEVISAQVLSHMSMGILAVALVAVFFGPISGCLAGCGGLLLASAILEVPVDYLVLIVLGAYGFFLGLYFGKLHYDMKVFTFRTFLDFNAIQIMTMIVCCMFVIPLVSFIANDTNLYDEVVRGAGRTVGNCFLVGIICPAAMLIVSLIKGEQNGA